MFKVAALYKFVSLPDFQDLQPKLQRICLELGLKGTLLLAEEGLNGTLAGTDEAIDQFIAELRHGSLFGERLDRLELKLSTAVTMPFQRLKIRLKHEIVTLGDRETDPTKRVGTYVDPGAWNDLLTQDDILLLDIRNDFEVAMGSFERAVNPKIQRFSDFKDFVEGNLDPTTHKKIVMFCTGGIRCEKASSYLLSKGFENVYHLKGGILKYLEMTPEAESRWNGACFVFDERVALGHGLKELPIARGCQVANKDE